MIDTQILRDREALFRRIAVALPGVTRDEIVEGANKYNLSLLAFALNVEAGMFTLTTDGVEVSLPPPLSPEMEEVIQIGLAAGLGDRLTQWARYIRKPYSKSRYEAFWIMIGG